MDQVNRRGFVRSAAAVAATGMIAKTSAAGDANERIRVAVIGVNGRGGDSHVPGFQNLNDKGVEVVLLCDPDKAILNRRAREFGKKYGTKPETETDMRKVFERGDIQAVSVATPNHWHSLATIWACQAGKDVYVEKPGSHNIFEGRKMVEAAAKYNRIVQHGVQLRSSEALQDLVKQLNEGVIGKVYMSRALIYRWRPSVGKQPSQPTPPSHLNWDMWLGPATTRDFSRKYHPYNWHWHWDFGNGDLGNQGVHELDMSLWGLGEETLPVAASAMGGKFLWDDDKECPEVMSSQFLFASGKMLEVEVRHWCTNHEENVTVGNIFYGSTGVALVDGYNRYRIIKGGVNDIRTEGPWVEKGGDHFGNFIECVKSRKAEDLHGPIITGHTSSAIAHLGNISYRLGRRLEIDPSAEKFVNDPEADRMLTREYREPYIVPAEV